MKFPFSFILIVLLAIPFTRVPANEGPFERVRRENPGEGRIVINQPHGVEQLLNYHVEWNKANPGVEGFRIQVFSGTGAQSRQQAREVRTRLLTMFPEETPILEYNAPFWRVRLGSFRHKHEAMPLLNKLKPTFPDGFIVRDPGIKTSEFKQ